MNQELSRIFHEMSALFVVQDVDFKPQAYEHAAYELNSLDEDVKDIYEKEGLKGLEEIQGVGKGIAEKIEEYIKTKHIKEYEKMKKDFPVDIDGLMSIEGVGPKMVAKLYKELKIKNLEHLEKAANAGKIAGISGLGKKTQDRILHGIKFLKGSGGRLILGFNMTLFRSILEKIKKVDGVEQAEFAGSVRRMQETVGDLDILVTSTKPEKVMKFFVSMPEVEAVHSQGETKSSVRLKIGIDADLRVLPPDVFGAGLQYFTGDKYHNIELRNIAIDKGYKLSEYGLFKDENLIAGKTEEEIYEKLGFKVMSPEMRTNNGELDSVKNKNLPDPIGYDDLRGDLQIQTEWTDGENSIEEMAKKAMEYGLEYICITDHTKSLAVAHGQDEKKLAEQMVEIDRINEKFKSEGIKFKILKGAEVDILKDGSLDLDDEALSKLDVVGISIHQNMRMTKEEMTKRIIKAMENPHADILFHPTGRRINKREPYEVDMDEILKAAKRTGTIMEINAFPDRLDLKDEYIRKALDMGLKFSIDSDGHGLGHFQFLEFGVAQARRAWCEAKDIINTRSWEEMLKMLKA